MEVTVGKTNLTFSASKEFNSFCTLLRWVAMWPLPLSNEMQHENPQ